jgi:6-phospho-beta-glucosidase
MGIKITVVGGGSSYTPELSANLVETGDGLDVEQVCLFDLNAEKLELIRSVSQKVLYEAGSNIQVTATQNMNEALTGCDYVVMQIRVGGLAARVRDETLPMTFGMVGNETTGAGGFVCGLRTVTAALQIARQVERLAPDAWLLNLSNPAGMVTEAILKHTHVRCLGFCNIPINTAYAIGRALGVDPTRIRLDSFGLNHLSWTRAAYVEGEEILKVALNTAGRGDSILYREGLVEEMIDPEWLDALHMVPGWYLRYFYYPDRVLEEDRRQGHTKGIDDMRAEERLQRIYASEGYTREAQQILSGKGGAQYYLPVLQVIDAMLHDRGDEVVVDTANAGAIPDLPGDGCVEIPCRIFRNWVEPIPVGQLSLSVRGLVQAVKNYEELTIEAAVTGSRKMALAALMAHPLVPSYAIAGPFFDHVLANEADFLPQFF